MCKQFGLTCLFDNKTFANNRGVTLRGIFSKPCGHRKTKRFYTIINSKLVDAKPFLSL